MADWVELRVHGVSGTPPNYMLGTPHTVQVAGDDLSRCFRPADWLGREQRAPDGHILEAFHWGRWTSGSWTQGLWLLLIPFGIVNSAQYMLPPPVSGPARVAHAISGALLRLLGLVLTGLFGLAASLVVVDLVAWQWLLRSGVPVPAWLVVAAALGVAALLIGSLARLGHGEVAGHYRFDRAGQRDLGRGSGLPGLGDAEFFAGDPDGSAARALHRATGVLVVAWLGLSVAADSGVGWAVAWRWFPVAVLGGVAVVVALGGRRHRWPAIALRLLTAAAGVLALAGLIGIEGDGSGQLPGMNAAVSALVVAGLAGVTALVLAVAVVAADTWREGRRPPRPFRRFVSGMAAGLAATVGSFLAVGFTSGLTLGVQGLLNGLLQAGVEAPALLERFSYAWGVTAIVFASVGLAARVWRRRHRAQFYRRARSAMTYGNPPRLRLPLPWVRRVGRAMQAAELKNYIPAAMLGWTLLGLLNAAAIGAAYLINLDGAGPVEEPMPPLDLLTGVRSPGSGRLTGDDVIIGLGQAVLLGIGLGTLLLARGALRSEGARRGLNVVWDVVAFWPRSAHPFVPSPYAQEVMPALVRRICWHLGVADPLADAADGDVPLNPTPVREIVVAAHSQGSLISLAALLWLPPETRDRVRFLTFGSQLRQQFARGFPAYVSADLLRAVAGNFRWVSLYRDTDPVAGPVLSWDHSPDGTPPTSRRLADPGELRPDWIDPATGRRVCGDEWRLLDPTPTDLALQTGAVTRIGGHGGYWTDPDWPLALAVARRQLPHGRVSRAGASVAHEQHPRQPADQIADGQLDGVGHHSLDGEQLPPAVRPRQRGVPPASGVGPADG